jgi:hypothetical protein
VSQSSDSFCPGALHLNAYRLNRHRQLEFETYGTVFLALSLCDTQLAAGSTFISSDGGSSQKESNRRIIN